MPRARSLILFLLLGAILNILIAWSVCITLKSGKPATPLSRTKSPRPQDRTPSTWPRSLAGDRGDPSQFTRTTNWGFTSDFAFWDHRIQNLNDHNEVPYQHATNVTNVGLPFRALRCRYEGHWIEMKQTGSQYLNCFRFDTPFAAGTLPYAPIWPGFLLNTFLYAALAGLLIRAPRHIRRTLRKRANRCPTCGYSRAGLNPTSPCPECGQLKSP